MPSRIIKTPETQYASIERLYVMDLHEESRMNIMRPLEASTDTKEDIEYLQLHVRELKAQFIEMYSPISKTVIDAETYIEEATEAVKGMLPFPWLLLRLRLDIRRLRGRINEIRGLRSEAYLLMEEPMSPRNKWIARAAHVSNGIALCRILRSEPMYQKIRIWVESF